MSFIAVAAMGYRLLCSRGASSCVLRGRLRDILLKRDLVCSVAAMRDVVCSVAAMRGIVCSVAAAHCLCFGRLHGRLLDIPLKSFRLLGGHGESF